ncbi:MAG: hypothetical protein JJT94_14215 [Bernardetiaceae bacterium]|nr:hypothetical protein [Bernardetiaceae bacterium]
MLVTLTDNIQQTARLVSATDYYPFGMAIHSRSWQSEGYRFGFNGKEDDHDVGDIQDYGFRIYNKAIARFLSVDPLAPDYPWYTPYQFAGNKPIWAIDLEGLQEKTKTDAFVGAPGYLQATSSGKVVEQTTRPLWQRLLPWAAKGASRAVGVIGLILMPTNDNGKPACQQGALSCGDFNCSHCGGGSGGIDPMAQHPPIQHIISPYEASNTLLLLILQREAAGETLSYNEKKLAKEARRRGLTTASLTEVELRAIQKLQFKINKLQSHIIGLEGYKAQLEGYEEFKIKQWVLLEERMKNTDEKANSEKYKSLEDRLVLLDEELKNLNSEILKTMIKISRAKESRNKVR